MTTWSDPSMQRHRRQVVFLAVVWMLITIKCMAVAWAVEHWKLPFKAGWLIYPTIAFALLATLLWVFHRPDDE